MKSLILTCALVVFATECDAFAQTETARQSVAGRVTIFARSDLNTGAVRVFDELTGAQLPTPEGLTGIRILPIDFVGRTMLMEFSESSPRYLTDVPSASRLVLPHSRGSLYRFSRIEPEGRVFGFLHIDRHGYPKAIAERLVSGKSIEFAPYLPLISVSPAGDSFLVATRHEEGGNAYEVNLEDGSMINRTQNMGPLRIARFGLGLQREWGVIATARGVLRFDRNTRLGSEFVQFGVQRPWHQGDLVFSRNGEWAMTLLGDDSDHLHVWAFGKNSAPQRISVLAESYVGAGFLPDHRSGPFMAISDDGMLCAWIDDHDASRELFMGRGPAFGVRDSERVTRPLYFHDTLDEIGQTAFFRPDRLTFLAGASDYIHIGMDRADVFEARMPTDTQTLEISNLSVSSGETEAPFVEYGTVEPDRVVWSEQEEQFLIYDGQVQESLFSLDKDGGGLRLLVSGIKDLDMLIAAPQGVLFDVRRTTPAGRVHEIFRVESLASQDPPELVRSAPVDTDFARPALRRDGWVTFVSVDTASDTEILSKVNVGSGVFESFALTSQSYGPALGYTPRGSVLFSLETPGATAYLLWPFDSSQAIALEASPETGFVLPPF